MRDGILHRVFYSRTNNYKGANPIYQIVAPDEVRQVIMEELHSGLGGGHLGREKTFEKVKSRFYWVGYKQDVIRWCISCDTCAQNKPGPHRKKAKLKQFRAGGPMEIIAMDIMGPLPETDKGNKYILVISDYFTKWAEAYALPDHTAVTIADKLLEEFMFRFGIARQIHTDQGSEFDSDLVHEVCRLLRIKKTRTTAYRPQSDGLVERHNRTIQGMLQATVNEARDDWDNHLPYVMFAYRSSVHATTKCTPNLLMLNREAYLPIDLLQPPPEDPKCPSHYVEWVRQVMRHSHETARKNTDTNMMRQKRNYDVGAGSPEFALGDQVLYHYPPFG